MNSISIVISAAVVAEGVTFPLDLIKTKLQLQGDNQRSKFASPNKNYEKLSYFKTLRGTFGFILILYQVS